MTLTYHDVMTADLSPLLDAAGVWQKMGERFGVLQTDYRKNVQGALAGGGWTGLAFDAQQAGAQATAYEYGAAQTEALAIANILREGHTELAARQKHVKDLVADAQANDFAVDGSGVVTYVGFDKLTDKERFAYRHDPDYPRLVAEYDQAARERTTDIRNAVQAVDDSDQGVKLALVGAATDLSPDGSGVGGFNGQADGDPLHAGGAGGDGRQTKTDGWHSDGSFTFLGPNAGFSVTGGPKYGKQGSVKAFADLFHLTAQGTLTNGHLKLSGIADANLGERVSANWGFSDKGVKAQVEASEGLRALAEGRAEYRDVGVYGRATGFAGAEGSGNLQAGKEGFKASAKYFVGAKGGVAGGTEVGGIGVGFNAEGWAGEGGEAKVVFGKDDTDGKWHFGAEVGAADLIGGDLGFEFTVDPHKVADAAGDVADAAGKAAHGIGHAASDAGHALSSVGKGIGSLF